MTGPAVLLPLLLAAAGHPAAAADDPLRGSSRAAEVSGGAFGPDGWRADKPTDYLRYELPEGTLAATVQFQVRGVRTDRPGDARRHLFAAADRYLGPKTHYHAENSTVLLLRVWTNDREGSRAGKTRLRAVGLGYGPSEAPGSKFQTDTEPLAWEADTWYTVRVRWTQTEAVFERNGRLVSWVSYPDRRVPYRQVFVNMGYYGKDMHGLSDVTYRDVTIRTEPAPATNQSLRVLGAGEGKTLLHAHLMGLAREQFRQRAAAFDKAVHTPGGVAEYQKRVRAEYRANLGPLPERTPLNPVVTGVLQRNGYRIEKVAFESRPRHHVTANLYVPDGAAAGAKRPAVLVPCGHSDNGKAKDSYQQVAVSLARNGFVALVTDPVGQGERYQFLGATGRPDVRGGTTTHTLLDVGGTLVGSGFVAHEVWNNVRSIDYLVGRPEVDADRIGVTGTSGGGAQTTFLVGIDDRIKAAAPSCFINPRSRMFENEGPYDGCAHLPNEGRFGHDHADYLLLQAPKPVLILGAEKDHKDIRGVWEAYREVKRGYTALGVPDRAEVFESPDGHGFFPAHRRAAVGWLKRWLANDPRPLVEGPEPVEADDALRVTKTGQVLTEWAGERKLADLTLDRAAALAADRERLWRADGPAGGLAEVRRLLGLPDRLPQGTVEHRGTLTRGPAVGGLRIDRLVLRRDGRVPVPALLFVPTAATGPAPAAVWIDGRGKETASGPGGPVEALARQGRVVLAIDSRGWGETADDPRWNDKKYFNAEHRTAVLANHIGSPLLGQRVEDVLAAFDVLAARREVDPKRLEVVGFGGGGPVALHAAALDGRVAGVTLRRSVQSWVDVVAAPAAPDLLPLVVPAALTRYDLPDLVKAVAPRTVTVVNPLTRDEVRAKRAVPRKGPAVPAADR